jgi:hypothetical protein
MRRGQLLTGVLTALAALGWVTPVATAQSITYTLKSGSVSVAGRDLLIWVQGSPNARPGLQGSGLALQNPFVVKTPRFWGDIDGASWVSPSPDGTGIAGGYEYFALFYVPSGLSKVALGVMWRGDDYAVPAVNGTQLGGFPGFQHFAPANPPSTLQMDVTGLVKPGAVNRISFFVENYNPGGVAINPSGVDFVVNLTLTP